jgi:hypothetical protein
VKNLPTILGILLIFILAVSESFGLFHCEEQYLVRHLPLRFQKEAQQVILLTMEKGPQGFSPLDVAMALRGLGKFHPRCILLNGTIQAEPSAPPLLPGIVSKMQAIPGLRLILPQVPAPEAEFQSLALVRYSLSSAPIAWPRLEGIGSPGSGSAYLPPATPFSEDASLPLLATAAHGVPVGSLWWWALPESLHQTPPLLLFGRHLFLNQRTQLQLTRDGSLPPASLGEFIQMPLDDFLLQIEKKEQGSISPNFDSLWDKSTILIGTETDVTSAAALASLLQEVSWHHWPVWGECTLTLFCLVLFLVSRWQKLFPNYFGSLFIGITLTMTAALLFPHGILFPFLTVMATALLLLLPRSP